MGPCYLSVCTNQITLTVTDPITEIAHTMGQCSVLIVTVYTVNYMGHVSRDV